MTTITINETPFFYDQDGGSNRTEYLAWGIVSDGAGGFYDIQTSNGQASIVGLYRHHYVYNVGVLRNVIAGVPGKWNRGVTLRGTFDAFPDDIEWRDDKFTYSAQSGNWLVFTGTAHDGHPATTFLLVDNFSTAEVYASGGYYNPQIVFDRALGERQRRNEQFMRQARDDDAVLACVSAWLMEL